MSAAPSKVERLRWLKGLPPSFVRGDCNDQTPWETMVKGSDRVFTSPVRQKPSGRKKRTLKVKNVVEPRTQSMPVLKIILAFIICLCFKPGRSRTVSEFETEKEESDSCESVSLYGKSKRMGEESALAHAYVFLLSSHDSSRNHGAKG